MTSYTSLEEFNRAYARTLDVTDRVYWDENTEDHKRVTLVSICDGEHCESYTLEYRRP